MSQAQFTRETTASDDCKLTYPPFMDHTDQLRDISDHGGSSNDSENRDRGSGKGFFFQYCP